MRVVKSTMPLVVGAMIASRIGSLTSCSGENGKGSSEVTLLS
jgi:hypothetical protein